jgi:thiamine biosynthesis lipoprotein
MGTLVAVTALHDSVDRVQEAAGRAFQELDRVVDLLNRYDPDSALFHLNREGAIHGPPPELAAVVSGSLRFSEMSGGAFDPTVQPLVDLLRRRVGGGKAPNGIEPDAEIRDTLSLVDARGVNQTPRAIRFSRDGMGITLDGIAKGYVVDLMAEVLGRHGLQDFLINAGGDIRSSGHREDGEAWRVAVQDPRKGGDFPDVIGLTNGSVATSGSYEIYFDRERTHHHIVSGRTGSSPHFSESVSVIAPTTMAADALATSVFVMEPTRGVAFIDSIPQCACLIVDREGRQHRSARWRSATGFPTRTAGATGVKQG